MAGGAHMLPAGANRVKDLATLSALHHSAQYQALSILQYSPLHSTVVLNKYDTTLQKFSPKRAKDGVFVSNRVKKGTKRDRNRPKRDKK